MSVSERCNCDLTAPELNRRPKEGHGFIYRYSFDDGKSYIGQTVWTIRARAINHSFCHTHVDRVIRSGKRFTAEIVAEVPIEYLNGAEWYCIHKFGTMSPKGYNHLNGGFFVRNMSAEAKMRRRRSLKAYHEKMSHDEKARFCKKVHDRNTQKMQIICLETGEVFESMGDAATSVGWSRHTTSPFSRIIRGDLCSIKGKHWMVYTESVYENREEALACLIQWEKESKEMVYRQVVANNLPNIKRLQRGNDCED